MNKDQFLNSGLLEQYVLGLTTPRESEMVEEFLIRYPELKSELTQLQQAMERYAMEQAVPPPPGLKKKVFSDLKTSGVRSNRLNRLITALSLAASLALLVLAILQYQTSQSLRGDKEKLALELASLKETCAEQQAAFQQYAAQIEFVQHHATRQIKLDGLGEASGAIATVYWNPQEKTGLLNLGTLPTPPAGKTYQIWADVDGEMINAGVIEPQAQDQLFAIKFIDQAESLNITLEPEGGSEHPTVSLLQANGNV